MDAWFTAHALMPCPESPEPPSRRAMIVPSEALKELHLSQSVLPMLQGLWRAGAVRLRPSNPEKENEGCVEGRCGCLGCCSSCFGRAAWTGGSRNENAKICNGTGIDPQLSGLLGFFMGCLWKEFWL